MAQVFRGLKTLDTLAPRLASVSLALRAREFISVELAHTWGCRCSSKKLGTFVSHTADQRYNLNPSIAVYMGIIRCELSP